MLLKTDPTHAFMPYPPVEVPFVQTGPLAGLTLGVKDIFDVAGYRTGCGSPVLLAQSDVKTEHNSAVALMLKAGARVVGKTHTEEIAWSLYGTNVHFGTPINPAAPDRVPGGSSSGSASAVAAGTCDVGLGSDTGGSVRAPASFCGIYGLRPTHGAIPLDHCMELAGSFDTCGFFARDAQTMLRVGQVLLPKGGKQATRPLIADDLFARLPAAVKTALAPAVAKVEALLGKAQPVTVYDRPVQPVYDAFRYLQAAEAFAVHGRWVDQQRPVLGPHIQPRIDFARSVTADQVVTGRTVRAEFAAHMHAMIGDGGVLIAPTVPGAAPKLVDAFDPAETFRHESMMFLMPAGLAGLPQYVIPAGKVDGAPVGLSLIGMKGSDLALLELATRL